MSLADPRTVDDLLNYRLSRLFSASGAMVVRLCEGRYGITRREWRLIALLAAHGAMSPSKLAERAHLERARTSRHITALAARKLIRRIQVPEDGRRAQIVLTAAGQRLYDELFPQSVRFNLQVLSVLTGPELQAFEDALAKLTGNAERIAATHPVPEKADRRHGGGRRLRQH
ncbi:MAG: MarR family winged helix-turn-helix transcriptional regulator [Ramlibacter sp.]|jgi:DNA-binding MarR family transcriptional regulator